MLFTFILKKEFQHHFRGIIKIVLLLEVLEEMLITHHSPYASQRSSVKVHLKCRSLPLNYHVSEYPASTIKFYCVLE